MDLVTCGIKSQFRYFYIDSVHFMNMKTEQ